LRELPYYIARFRLFNSVKHRSGPPTGPIVAAFEQSGAAPTAELKALGRGAPKCMGARLTVSLQSMIETASWVTRCQVRFRDTSTLHKEEDLWEEVEPMHVDSAAPDVTSALVREEDGLELGRTYVFQARLGDNRRMGPWSATSKSLRFVVPPPVPQPGSGIKVIAEPTSAEFSWSPFRAQPSLVENIASFAELPVEYVMVISTDSSEDPVATRTTRDTFITIKSLAPSTAYRATLSARWTRFGELGRQDAESHLLACFLTAPSKTRMVAELSMRFTGDQDGTGATAGRPAVAELPVDQNGPAAVTLDLDPFFLHPRPAHAPLAFVRKPSVPPLAPPGRGATARELGSPPAQADADGATPDNAGGTLGALAGGGGVLHPGVGRDRSMLLAERGGRAVLPQLVPLPPPKFTVRDPLTFALPRQPNSARPASLRRFRSQPGGAAAEDGASPPSTASPPSMARPPQTAPH